MKKKIIIATIFSIALIFMAIYINEFNSYLYAFIGMAAMWAVTYSESLRNRALLRLEEVTELYSTEVECNIKQRNKIDYLDAELDEK